MTNVGTPTFFFTFSSADMHWPELHSLFRDITNSSSKSEGKMSSIIPTLFTGFFTQRLEKFIKHWLYNTLDAEWHWYRYQYQGKGSIHCHGTAKLRNDPQLHVTKTALRMSMRYTYFTCRELCLAIYFLIDNICVRFGSSVFRQVIGIPMGTNSATLLADLFLHTFEYDFMVEAMTRDITKAIQFSNTFRYIEDIFSINNVDFGNHISAIYPSELQLTYTSTSSTEVCYLNKNIKTGDTNTPFRISIYNKRDDFTSGLSTFLI